MQRYKAIVVPYFIDFVTSQLDSENIQVEM